MELRQFYKEVDRITQTDGRNMRRRVRGLVKDAYNSYTSLPDRERLYCVAVELYNRAGIIASKRHAVNPEGLRDLLWRASIHFYEVYRLHGGSLDGEFFYSTPGVREIVTWEDLFNGT